MNQFRTDSRLVADWICDYLADLEQYEVLPAVQPGMIAGRLGETVPTTGKAIPQIFQEFKDCILPGITHWNHPGFFGYFNSSTSEPALVAEWLAAAMNTNCMLWQASPAGTEVEQVVLKWVQQMLGLSGFWGMILDGGSSSNFHALCAVRQQLYGDIFRKRGFSGLKELPQPRIYISQQTHNSIHKAVVTSGFGLDSLHVIPENERYEMLPDRLLEAIRRDRDKGFQPACVVATLGSTSCTALDPVAEIAEICRAESLWCHIDAAHGGPAALLEEMRDQFQGWEYADSITINPHKWLFVPLDLSILYTKKSQILKNAFSYDAEYLKTQQDDIVQNYMDYGLTLGRRFRALKLWFTLKHFGLEGIRAIIREHIRLAQLFYCWVEKSAAFEIMAPLTLSTVCFRAKAAGGLDDEELNGKLLERINQSGRFFITHTRLNRRLVLRLVVSNLRTTEKHIRAFIEILDDLYKKIVEAGFG